MIFDLLYGKHFSITDNINFCSFAQMKMGHGAVKAKTLGGTFGGIK